MYGLYWIRYVSHLNPYQDGYIGITSQSLKKRFNDHKSNTKNKHLRNVCRKGDAIISFLYSNLSKEKAKELELFYRPLKYIGWNIAIGGDIPPSRLGIPPAPKDPILIKKIAQEHSARLRGRPSPKKGKRYSSPKICNLCKVEFFSGHSGAKFCSSMCAGSVNKELSKRNIISQKARIRWTSVAFRTQMSIEIRRGIREGKSK